MISRQEAAAVYRNHFGAFMHAAFKAVHGVALHPNWHIDLISFEVEKIATSTGRGRLVINLPPRSLKSFILSICLPAWMLGRNPAARVICASYSEDLAYKF